LATAIKSRCATAALLIRTALYREGHSSALAHPARSGQADRRHRHRIAQPHPCGESHSFRQRRSGTGCCPDLACLSRGRRRLAGGRGVGQRDRAGRGNNDGAGDGRRRKMDCRFVVTRRPNAYLATPDEPIPRPGLGLAIRNCNDWIFDDLPAAKPGSHRPRPY
jgi:hypothetical protein